MLVLELLTELLDLPEVLKSFHAADDTTVHVVEDRGGHLDGYTCSPRVDHEDRCVDGRFSSGENLLHHAGVLTDVRAKYLAASVADGILPAYARYLLGGLIEGRDPPFEVYRKYALVD